MEKLKPTRNSFPFGYFGDKIRLHQRSFIKGVGSVSSKIGYSYLKIYKRYSLFDQKQFSFLLIYISYTFLGRFSLVSGFSYRILMYQGGKDET